MARIGISPGSLQTSTALAIMLAVAVAGCSSSRSSKPSAEVEIDPSPASQANIASLTAVVKQNPADPGGYNVRGTAFGKAGKLNEALADFDQDGVV
jgi:hypothetical protein